jgi:hypothetical protein
MSDSAAACRMGETRGSLLVKNALAHILVEALYSWLHRILATVFPHMTSDDVRLNEGGRPWRYAHAHTTHMVGLYRGGTGSLDMVLKDQHLHLPTR